MQGIDAAFTGGEVQARLVEVTHMATWSLLHAKCIELTSFLPMETQSKGVLQSQTCTVPYCLTQLPCQQHSPCTAEKPRQQINGFTSHWGLENVIIICPRVKNTLHEKEMKLHSGTQHRRSSFPFILVRIQQSTEFTLLRWEVKYALKCLPRAKQQKVLMN